ncbi:MAG TPA: S24/S26 family peptidase [Kineosporiaceae bacterium]|nr:S24/S26 family peptidase [Kineosporiaceae bacterium]
MRYDGAVPHQSPITGIPRLPWWVAVVRGRSMLPTLRDGDRLLVRSGTAGAVAGRIAVVRLPGRPLSVKRLAFQEPGGWWVEKDNPREGVDSWDAGVGAVPDADLVAVALLRLWPRPGRLPDGPPHS